MRLSDEERAMLAGELGEVRRWAIEHQITVGEFFDAADFVPVSQAHIMADTESLGEAGVRFLEQLAAAPEAERRVRVPTITDPRGIDFAAYRRLGLSERMAALERRAIDALRAFGVLMTDTCINYQTIMAPLRAEHVAYGDTGVVIYSNSVLGARSNFEGGPSALGGGIDRPHPALRLSSRRMPTCDPALSPDREAARPCRMGCGRRHCRRGLQLLLAGPAHRGRRGRAGLRHAQASWRIGGELRLGGACSTCRGSPPRTRRSPARHPTAAQIGRAEIDTFLARYDAPGDKLDVVVFGAPQLSLFEIEAVAQALDGRRVHPDTGLLVTTSPEIKHAADRMGLTRRIEMAGAIVAEGICFYQSYAREMAEANHWTRLMTNSAKLVNIIGGYGYRPSLASLERCVDSAVAGRVL